MQQKILPKQALLIAIPLGFILFVALILHYIPKNLNQDSPALFIENVSTLSIQEPIITGLPVRLQILEFGIDSIIIPMGLTSDGAMDVPKDLDKVAWFNLGPRPGESGSAVIAGHYGWKNNISAVFNNLHKLHKGDKISIEDEKGVTSFFIVRETQTYDKDEIIADVFESDDGKAHLNLITCIGVWDKAQQTFSNRLIVFTDKE